MTTAAIMNAAPLYHGHSFAGFGFPSAATAPQYPYGPAFAAGSGTGPSTRYYPNAAPFYQAVPAAGEGVASGGNVDASGNGRQLGPPFEVSSSFGSFTSDASGDSIASSGNGSIIRRASLPASLANSSSQMTAAGSHGTIASPMVHVPAGGVSRSMYEQTPAVMGVTAESQQSHQQSQQQQPYRPSTPPPHRIVQHHQQHPHPQVMVVGGQNPPSTPPTAVPAAAAANPRLTAGTTPTRPIRRLPVRHLPHQHHQQPQHQHHGQQHQQGVIQGVIYHQGHPQTPTHLVVDESAVHQQQETTQQQHPSKRLRTSSSATALVSPSGPAPPSTAGSTAAAQPTASTTVSCPSTPYRTPKNATSIAQRQAQRSVIAARRPRQQLQGQGHLTPQGNLTQQGTLAQQSRLEDQQPAISAQFTAGSTHTTRPLAHEPVSSGSNEIVPVIMADPSAEALGVKGPLVGQLQPSTALTTEYAAADPVYQAKTAALPQKFSHYRTVRGDGKCGWRAIAFGYFESLVRMNKAHMFAEEQNRMLLLRRNVTDTGTPAELCEDFFDELIDLLKNLGQALPNGTAEAVLLETFNNEGVQEYIVFCMKLLTSAEIKSKAAEYAPYLETQTVDQFCEYIQTIEAELDHRSLNALHSALLSPADIALEVLYLDRSEGSEVNAHRWDTIPGVEPAGVVRLLYRPGHYDILYKQEDLNITQPEVQTFLQYSSPFNFFPDIDASFEVPGFSFEPNYSVNHVHEDPSHVLLSIPGMSYLHERPDNWLSMGDASLLPCAATAIDLTTPLPSVPVPPQDLNLQSMPTFVPSVTLGAHAMPYYSAPPQMASFEMMAPPPVQIHNNETAAAAPVPYRPATSDAYSAPPPQQVSMSMSVPMPPPPPAATTAKTTSTAAFRDPFRKSSVQHQHEKDMVRPSTLKLRQPPLLTKPMQQSPCSEAHYGNIEFQPITYDPKNPKASDLPDGGVVRSAKRKQK